MKRFFLPNQYSEHPRAHSVNAHSLFTYAFSLVLFLFASSWITYHPEVLGYATNVSVRELFFQTNKLRAEKNLPPLKLNTKLNEAASKKAQNMISEDYWAHTSPEGKQPWDFIRSAGYNYIYAGENLAVDFAQSDEIISAWYDSISHRENLLNDKFTEVGYATLDGTLKGRKTTLVVQMFGYPKDIDSSLNLADGISEPLSDEEILNNFDKSSFIYQHGKYDFLSNVDSEKTIYSFFPVLTLSRAMAIVVGIFLVGIFAVDGYYARKLNQNRITGHTLLHILLLVLAIFGIWLTNVGMIM